jgi:hypothetical protein
MFQNHVSPRFAVNLALPSTIDDNYLWSIRALIQPLAAAFG